MVSIRSITALLLNTLFIVQVLADRSKRESDLLDEFSYGQNLQEDFANLPPDDEGRMVSSGNDEFDVANEASSPVHAKSLNIDEAFAESDYIYDGAIGLKSEESVKEEEVDPLFANVLSEYGISTDYIPEESENAFEPNIELTDKEKAILEEYDIFGIDDNSYYDDNYSFLLPTTTTSSKTTTTTPASTTTTTPASTTPTTTTSTTTTVVIPTTTTTTTATTAMKTTPTTTTIMTMSPTTTDLSTKYKTIISTTEKPVIEEETKEPIIEVIPVTKSHETEQDTTERKPVVVPELVDLTTQANPKLTRTTTDKTEIIIDSTDKGIQMNEKTKVVPTTVPKPQSTKSTTKALYFDVVDENGEVVEEKEHEVLSTTKKSLTKSQMETTKAKLATLKANTNVNEEHIEKSTKVEKTTASQQDVKVMEQETTSKDVPEQTEKDLMTNAVDEFDVEPGARKAENEKTESPESSSNEQEAIPAAGGLSTPVMIIIIVAIIIVIIIIIICIIRAHQKRRGKYIFKKGKKPPMDSRTDEEEALGNGHKEKSPTNIKYEASV